MGPLQAPVAARFSALGYWMDAPSFTEMEHLGGGGGGWVAGRKRMSSLLTSRVSGAPGTSTLGSP